MATYKGIPIRAVTESAMYEAEATGLNLDDVAGLLEDSYDCAKGTRRKDVEERCIRKGGKILKIVVELKTSMSGFEYWRIREIGFVR